MAIRKIVRYPDLLLRTPTVKVSSIDKEIRQLVDDMIETMVALKGAGIAAIQVGALQKIFVIDAPVAGLSVKDDPLVFINPSIEFLSKEKETKEEGCLSFPGLFVPVRRSLMVRLVAQDLNGNPISLETNGFYARALQHEQDHLDNRLLIDFAGTLQKKRIEKTMATMTDEEAWDILANSKEETEL